jgi:hypothetical protein
MLCHGEVLRKFEISVRELLDRSENSHRQSRLLQRHMTDVNENPSYNLSAQARGGRIPVYFTVRGTGAATF